MKIIKELSQAEKQKKRVEKAETIFAEKLYADEYRVLFIILKLSGALGSVASAAGGASFLYFTLVRTLPFVASIVISVAVFVLVEVAKAFLADVSIKKYYTTQKLPAVTIFAVMLFSASVFFSLSGVKELYIQLNTEKNEIQTDFSMLRSPQKASIAQSIFA